jgi:hypothetical protein
MRSFLLIAAIVQLLITPASAQDWPLFQPFRIGNPLAGSFANRLMASDALDREWRRMGLIASWHAFEDGLTVVRALHVDEIDIALDIAQRDVILAKAEDLSMVFVSVRRRIDGNDKNEQAISDENARRYTLTSGFYAERREQALLSVVRALGVAAVGRVHSGPEVFSGLDSRRHGASRPMRSISSPALSWRQVRAWPTKCGPRAGFPEESI